MSRPFRTQVRLATHEQEEGALPVGDALWALLRERAPDAMAAVRHPDERVPIAWTMRQDWGEEGARRALAARAFAEAEAQDVAWTPLLDALVHSGLFPSTGEPSGLRVTPPSGVPQDPRVREMLERIARWVRDQTSVQEIGRVLQFESIALRRMVAAEARVIGPEQAEELASHATCRQALAANPHLAPQVVAHLQVLAAGWLSETGGALRSNGSALLNELRDAGHPLSEKGREALLSALEEGQTRDGFSHLIRDPELGEAGLIRLIGLGFGTNPYGGLVAQVALHPCATPETRSAQFAKTRAGDSAESLLRAEVLPPDVFTALLRDVTSSTDMAKLIAHGSSTPEIWHAGMERCGAKAEVRAALASNPRARRDPAIRRVLLASNADTVLQALLEDAEPAEFRRLMRKLLRDNPEAALRRLEQNEVPEGSGLGPRDMEPIFERHPNLRLRAFAVLNRLQPIPEPLATTPSRTPQSMHGEPSPQFGTQASRRRAP
jgi:hypothetical protein